MKQINKRKKQAKLIRDFRKVHRTTGVALFIFFFFISLSGLMLGWKKHTNGLILPPTQLGLSADFKNWLPIDSLHTIACKALHDSVSPDLSLDLDKIDVRKNDGIIKFVFRDSYWGIQLDGSSGEVLQVEKRLSDYIEDVHDGAILDYYFGTSGEQIKLFYTSIMGLALLAFTVTGFWLWYGPRRMRKQRPRH